MKLISKIPCQAEVCPLCGEKGTFVVRSAKDYFIAEGKSPDFDVAYCPACLTGYSLPYLNPTQLSSYYLESYEAYVAKKPFSAYFKKLKYRSDLRLLGKFLKKENRSLFEIGAGRGEFLHEARKRGFRVAGLEPSEPAVRFAQEKYGITLATGPEEDFNFSSPFDAVVLRHVLEHLPDPALSLRKIFDRGLKTGGVLMLKLPRLDSWEAKWFGKFWRGLDLPRHRTHFTKTGILKLLEKTGFREIKIYSEVIPSDIAGSIGYYSIYGSGRFLKPSAKFFQKLPLAVRWLAAQVFGVVLSPLRPGRMIVIAKK
ncbi:MAG: class I SAM-dependent methyltransferase [Candidatus Omnitrophica bacterium]|nr:class I SAM-dependent methyltransferase [Candidatus Omnitrophota bacterium]